MTSGQTISGNGLRVLTEGHCSPSFPTPAGPGWSRGIEFPAPGASHLRGGEGWFQRRAPRRGEEKEPATKLEIIPNWFLLLGK